MSDYDSLDQLCDAFDRSWREKRNPNLAEFLERLDEDQFEKVFADLLRIEIEYRVREGQTPVVEDYGPAFPRHTTTIQQILQETLPVRHHPQVADDAREPKVIGEFALLELIGRGGMGSVYKARQKGLNRIVALKTITSGTLAGPEQIKRFESEARTAGEMDHPSIVPVYEFGEDDGRFYYTMGFVEGRNLQDIGSDGPLEVRRAARIVRDLAEAVAYAHDKGVIHRDLKPANVLMSGDRPRITDFGLAKSLEAGPNLTETGQLLGTPAFMAPEQAAGNTRAVGFGTDIYGLGAILYSLLTGRPPFQAATAAATALQIIHNDVLSPRELNTDVDRDLATVCLKCLRKEISHRYLSAQELREDLSRYLQGHPVQARPVSRLAKVRRWVKRNPLTAALTSAIMLGVVLIAIAASWGYLYTSSLLRRETKALTRAGQNLEVADQAISKFLMQMSEDKDLLRGQPGTHAKRRELLEFSVSFYRRLREANPELPEYLLRSLVAERVLADFLHVIGKDDLAIQRFEAIVTELQSQLQKSPGDDFRRELVECFRGLSATYLEMGDVAQGRRYVDQAIAIADELPTKNAAELVQRANLSNLLAGALILNKQPDQVEPYLEQARNHLQKASQTAGETPDKLAAIAAVYNNFGAYWLQTGQADKAKVMWEEAARIMEKLVAARPQTPEYISSLAGNYQHMIIYYKKRDPKKAADYFAKADKLLRQASRDNPELLQLRTIHRDVRLNYTVLLVVHQRFDEAIQFATSLVADAAKIQALFETPTALQGLYRCQKILGDAYSMKCLKEGGLKEADMRQAMNTILNALKSARRLSKGSPTNNNYLYALGSAHKDLAGFLAISDGDTLQATANCDLAEKAFRQLLKRLPKHPAIPSDLAKLRIIRRAIGQ